MKTQLISRMVCITLFLGMLSLNQAHAVGNVSLLYGNKKLDDIAWQPVENQQEFGLMLDFQISDLPVNIAIDYLKSDDTGVLEGATYKGETDELHLGLRQYINEGETLVPYIGGGVAFIEGEYSGNGRFDTDVDAGFWVGVGLNWMLGQHFHVGIDMRLSSADLTLYERQVDGGGAHYAITTGISF